MTMAGSLFEEILMPLIVDMIQAQAIALHGKLRGASLNTGVQIILLNAE